MAGDKKALTDKEATDIGRSLRAARDGNLVVGGFAAELVGESYPFSKRMWDIVFRGHSDVELGRRFAAWCDKGER